MSEEQRQKAKEEAVLLALQHDTALIRRDLEIWGMWKDGSTECLSKSSSYESLWEDALSALREKYKNKKPVVNVHVAVGVVIHQDGKYLLVQEAKRYVRGLWNLPAGKVDVGDTIEETAIKEAKEEVSYDVKLVRKLGVFHAKADEAPKHAFEARIIGGSLAWPKNEIMDAKWFTWQEILDMKEKLRNPWVIEAIQVLVGGAK